MNKHYVVVVVLKGGAYDSRLVYASSERQAKQIANRNGDVAQFCRVTVAK
jgi:hypothetical protein